MKSRARESSRRVALAAAVISLFACASLFVYAPRGRAQTEAGEQPGLAELKKGEYEHAVQVFGARLAKNPADAEAEKYLLRAYVETGRYAEAETSARKFLSKTPEAGGVRHMLGEALAATGRYAEAVREFEAAAQVLAKSEGHRAERLESELRRAEVLELTGQESRAREIFQSLVGYYNESGPEAAPELTVVARAFARLDKPKDASDLYVAAIDDDSSHIEAQL
ncbi:MAG TPA: tetratricopeptide repeat protein, partial [Pyrinomonadaceae bacterium]